MDHNYYVYIMTNRYHSILYTVVTNDIDRRAAEHALGEGSFFYREYNVNKLVYVEHYREIDDAISREKQIKGYRREKKLALIRKANPNWNDLRKKVDSPKGVPHVRSE